MTDLEQTMKIRKAVAPLVKELVSHEESMQKLTKEAVKAFTESVKRIEQLIEKLGTQSEPIVINQTSNNLDDLKEFSSNILHEFRTQSIDINENLGKAIKQSEKNINKMAESIAEVIIKALPEQKEYTQHDPMPVKLTEQYIGTSTGGQAGNSDDRVWLREEYTYVTVSGNQVVRMVERWNHDSKLTEIFDYDENANVIAKSRSFEASNGVGV